MNEIKRFSLVKPSLQTPFHIDFNWWTEQNRDWRIFLRDYLSSEEQAMFENFSANDLVDLVDPDTGEVTQVEPLQHVLISRYASRNDFITRNTSVTEAIFRLFLTNGNTPLTVMEIAEKIGRSPTTILQLLAGREVYKGLRPCPPRN